MKKTKILCILDGFGMRGEKIGNPFWVADIPNFRKIFSDNIWIGLNADGTSVGQESGLVGNSEVGHMNMGGLQLVKQLSLQITESVRNNFDLSQDYSDQKYDPKIVLVDNWVIHIVGLFSVGTIHSDQRHLLGAIRVAGEKGMKIFLHLISDGRDSDRTSFAKQWKDFVEQNGDVFKKFSKQIFLGSLGGRFFAMDRDKNLDRTKKYLAAIFGGEKEVGFNSIYKEIEDITFESYSRDVYDEFIEPRGYRGIQEGEFVWFFNFRTDRMKQLVGEFCKINDQLENRSVVLANNSYGIGSENSIKNVDKRKGYYPIFENSVVKKTLSEFISKKGMNQLHIAETEKYNHVTYFFNGGSNKKQKNEDWVVIDSNKIENHGDKPEMKAREVTDYIIKEGVGKYDFVIVNYANADMVGHSGDFAAAVKTLEVMDKQIGRLVKAVENNRGEMIITADHGNIECVGILDNGEVDTKHNANPVPMIIIGDLDVEKVIKKITPILEKDSIYPDEIRKNLMNYNDNEFGFRDVWMEKDQIPKQVLPLWYVGLFLINL